jgi:superfamily II DNA/RNA helicase
VDECKLLVYGGAPYREQEQALRGGVDIVVGRGLHLSTF